MTQTPPLIVDAHEDLAWNILTFGRDYTHSVAETSQLDAYHRLVDEHPDLFRLVLTRSDLEAVLDHWQRPDTPEHPVGLVVLMENAEGVRPPAELEEWWVRGVRIIGPAWAGTRLCGGTRQARP